MTWIKRSVQTKSLPLTRYGDLVQSIHPQNGHAVCLSVETLSSPGQEQLMQWGPPKQTKKKGGYPSLALSGPQINS